MCAVNGDNYLKGSVYKMENKCRVSNKRDQKQPFQSGSRRDGSGHGPRRMRSAAGSASGLRTAQVRPGLRGDPGGDPGPASSSVLRPGRPSVAPPRLPRHRAPRTPTPGSFPWCWGLGRLGAQSPVRRARAFVADRGREASLRGRAGVAGGFWTSGTQPPLKLCLLLSRRRGRAPFPQGQCPFVVARLETLLASLPVLPGLGAFPPPASRGALSFLLRRPPCLLKHPLSGEAVPWCRSLHPQLQASPASREPSAAITTSRRHVPP